MYIEVQKWQEGTLGIASLVVATGTEEGLGEQVMAEGIEGGNLGIIRLASWYHWRY